MSLRTTGLFTIHEFPIVFQEWNRPIYLFPFGDIHRFAPLHCEERWLAFADWAKRKQNAYFLGMGDYLDIISTSERKTINAGTVHDSTNETLEEFANSLNYKFAKELQFMKGRLVGLLEGNHYWQFASGLTSTQKLADLLSTKYLGVSSMVNLSLRYRNSTTTLKCVVRLHHGRAGGRVAGAGLRAVEQMADACECDIALMADSHQKLIDYKTKLVLRTGLGLKLHQKKVLLGRTGSFLKGYEPDKVSYIADKDLGPTDLGVIKIELTPRRDQKGSDEKWLDIHASL